MERYTYIIILFLIIILLKIIVYIYNIIIYIYHTPSYSTLLDARPQHLDVLSAPRLPRLRDRLQGRLAAAWKRPREGPGARGNGQHLKSPWWKWRHITRR
jgi:hypothetical protein